jgi:broad specificity phosphatase PhoE
MKLYFIRHGESLGNAQHILLGRTDLDLSELGYRQAAATAEAMRDFSIDLIYSSSLKRALNTAVPHGKLHGLPVIPDDELCECRIGEWENKTSEWCRENYGTVFTEDWVFGFGTFRFPGGESTMEGGRRVYNRVLEICRENPDKNILFVAHAAVLRAFWGIISGISPETLCAALPFPTNASYSVCEFDGEKIIPEKYSCDGHLTDIGITAIKYS